MRYTNNEVKEKYWDYKIEINKKLNLLKKTISMLNESDNKIHYGHLGDLTKIDQGLSDILNYLI